MDVGLLRRVRLIASVLLTRRCTTKECPRRVLFPHSSSTRGLVFVSALAGFLIYGDANSRKTLARPSTRTTLAAELTDSKG